MTYKYEDYQEAGGRIAVQTQSALVGQDLGPDTHLQFSSVLDAIAGATPTGEPAPAGSNQVVLTQLNHRRKAWDGQIDHQFPRINLSLDAAFSQENNYVSDGLSLNSLTDFNEKNTTLLAGFAGTEDRVQVFYQPKWAKKHTHDVILGVTQLLDPNTSVTFNVTWGRATGYLSEHEKLVQQTVAVLPGIFITRTFPENRPDERDKGIAYVSLNHAYPRLNGAAEVSYRFYADTFGTRAHTVEAAWFQHAGARLILSPNVRFYRQSAANFYYYDLEDTGIIPGFQPKQQGPFYSSDYRLSALFTYTYGLKAVWTVADWLEFDAAFEKYVMRGLDGVTPQSAYARANITTAGLKLSW